MNITNSEIARRLKILDQLDSVDDNLLDDKLKEVLELVPYRIQKFVPNNNEYGTFFRVRIREIWFEKLEDFFPDDTQSKSLGRCLAPDNDTLFYACDEDYWNVFSELINPNEFTNGKISVLIFKIKNPQDYRVALTFSDLNAESTVNSMTNLSDYTKGLYLAFLKRINEYFYRKTESKVYDYRISSRLSRLYYDDFIMKHTDVIGIQYMPVRRNWLPNFGQTLNYAFLMSRIKDLIVEPIYNHMEYRIDLKEKRFYFTNKGDEKEYHYDIII